ncbi:hypothetical protein LOK49_LG10G01281 [Camellia lanceoleosa]|uniref:Uncharacterized protein n=1 Tax=Camellia lanceoleosa TaxID=1840588 RepID=A0ACC0GA54_9ERIC|nr:hypothetical protein LOK49_LG10G01281 [Camellia lanceoleosa]
MEIQDHHCPVDPRLLTEIQRDPTHILGWFDPNILQIWMSLSQYSPFPAHLLNRQTVIVTYLSTPYTHLTDRPSQTIQLNQIIVPTTNFLPNLQPFLDPCLTETLLPIPPLPILDHHCLANHLRTFVLEGHCYQAERIIAEPNLHLLRVSVKSFMMQGNSSLTHNIALIPTLAVDPVPLGDIPLGPGWITNNEEAIDGEAITPPLLPLFNPPMKVLLWNCRGAASPHFRRHFFTLVNEYHPQLVILTETRVGGTRGKTLSDNLGFSKVHISEPIGFAEGIWLLWNDLEIDYKVLLTTEQEIHAWIKVLKDANSFLLGNVYISTCENEKYDSIKKRHKKKKAKTNPAPSVKQGNREASWFVTFVQSLLAVLFVLIPENKMLTEVEKLPPANRKELLQNLVS